MNSVQTSDHNYVNAQDETNMTTMDVDVSDMPIVARLKNICEDWERIKQCEDTADQPYVHVLLCSTVRLTLSHLWKTIDIDDRLALRRVLSEMSWWGCRAFACLLPNPWGYDELLDDDPKRTTATDDQSLYGLEREVNHVCGLQCDDVPRNVLHARVELLCYCDFRNVALQLCLLYRQCRSHQEDYFYAQTIFHLLFHSGNIRRMVEELQPISCHDGLQLIQYILADKGPSAHNLVECLTQILLVRDLLGPSPYCCTLALMKKWCWLHYQQRSETQVVTEEASKLGALAVSSAQLYLLVDVLFKQYGRQLLPLYFKLYIHALTIDINNLEYARQIDCRISVAELETNMAGVYTKLATLIDSDKGTGFVRECLLTAFSLEPTLERLNELQRRAPSSSSIWRYSRTFVFPCQGECHCAEKGLCRRDNELPPWYLTDVPNGILDTVLPGVSDELLQDLCVLVEGPRCHWLSWNIPWNELCVLCTRYLHSARALRVGGDDPQVGIDARMRRQGLLDSKLFQPSTLNRVTTEQPIAENISLRNVKVEPESSVTFANDNLNVSMENMMSSDLVESSPPVSSPEYPVLHIEDRPVRPRVDGMFRNPGYPLLQDLERPKASTVNRIVQQKWVKSDGKPTPCDPPARIHLLNNKQIPVTTRRIGMLPAKRPTVNPAARYQELKSNETANERDTVLSSITSANPYLSSLLGAETQYKPDFPLSLLDGHYTSKNLPYAKSPIRHAHVVPKPNVPNTSPRSQDSSQTPKTTASPKVQPHDQASLLRTLSLTVPSVSTIAVPSAYMVNVPSQQANSQQQQVSNSDVNSLILAQTGRMEVSKIHIHSPFSSRLAESSEKASLVNNVVKPSNGAFMRPTLETNNVTTPSKPSLRMALLHTVPDGSAKQSQNSSTEVKYYVQTSRDSVNLVQPVQETRLQTDIVSIGLNRTSPIPKVELVAVNFPKVGDSPPPPPATPSTVISDASTAPPASEVIQQPVQNFVNAASVKLCVVNRVPDKGEVITPVQSNNMQKFKSLVESSQQKAVIAVSHAQRNVNLALNIRPPVSQTLCKVGANKVPGAPTSRRKKVFTQSRGPKWESHHTVHGAMGIRRIKNEADSSPSTAATTTFVHSPSTSRPGVVSVQPTSATKSSAFANLTASDVSRLPIVKKCSPAILNCGVQTMPSSSVPVPPAFATPITLGVFKSDKNSIKMQELWKLVTPSGELNLSQEPPETSTSNLELSAVRPPELRPVVTVPSNFSTTTASVSNLSKPPLSVLTESENFNQTIVLSILQDPTGTGTTKNIVVKKLPTKPNIIKSPNIRLAKPPSASKKAKPNKSACASKTGVDAVPRAEVTTVSSSESGAVSESSSFQAQFVSTILKSLPKGKKNVASKIVSNVTKQMVQSLRTLNNSVTIDCDDSGSQNDISEANSSTLVNLCASDHPLPVVASSVVNQTSSLPSLLSERLSACCLSSPPPSQRSFSCTTRGTEAWNVSLTSNSALDTNTVNSQTASSDFSVIGTGNQQSSQSVSYSSSTTHLSAGINSAPIFAPVEYNPKDILPSTSSQSFVSPSDTSSNQSVAVASTKTKLVSLACSSLAPSYESLAVTNGQSLNVNKKDQKDVRSLKSELGKFITIGQAVLGVNSDVNNCDSVWDESNDDACTKLNKSVTAQYKCDTCQKSLTTERGLERHKAKHARDCVSKMIRVATVNIDQIMSMDQKDATRNKEEIGCFQYNSVDSFMLEVESASSARGEVDNDCKVESTSGKKMLSNDVITERHLKSCFVQLVRQDISNSLTANHRSDGKECHDTVPGESLSDDANSNVAEAEKCEDKTDLEAEAEAAKASTDEGVTSLPEVENLAVFDCKEIKDESCGNEAIGVSNEEQSANHESGLLSKDSVEDSLQNVESGDKCYSGDDSSSSKNESEKLTKNENEESNIVTSSNEFCMAPSLENNSLDSFTDTVLAIEFEAGQQPVISQTFGSADDAIVMETKESKAVMVAQDVCVVDTRPVVVARGRSSSRTVKPPQKRCCHCCENSAPSPTQSPKKCRVESTAASKGSAKIARRSRGGGSANVAKLNTTSARS